VNKKGIKRAQKLSASKQVSWHIYLHQSVPYPQVIKKHAADRKTKQTTKEN